MVVDGATIRRNDMSKRKSLAIAGFVKPRFEAV